VNPSVPEFGHHAQLGLQPVEHSEFAVWRPYACNHGAGGRGSAVIVDVPDEYVITTHPCPPKPTVAESPGSAPRPGVVPQVLGQDELPGVRPLPAVVDPVRYRATPR
jgi:hypothetical protein